MRVLASLARSFVMKHWNHRKTQFDTLPLHDGDIVFIGDSITEQAEWIEMFPGLPIRNRGISADTTTGVLDRIEQITAIKPAAVFLLIGTNDVTVKVKDSEILANIEEILKKLRAAAPECQIYVTGILPRKKKRAAHLKALNVAIVAVAGRYGATSVDLWPVLTDANGAIRPEFSNDALHLSGAGYQLWAGALKAAAPVLQS